MRTQVKISVLFNILLGIQTVVGFSPANAFAHGDESRVSVELDSESAVPAGDIILRFDMIDSEKRALISDRDLAVQHEKKLHLFVFDPALREFRHEHPEYIGSKWQVKLSLPVSGNYWIWAQGLISADGEEFSASARLEVKGGAPANPVPASLGEVRSGYDGNSVATLSGERLIAGRMSMLNLVYSRQDGSAPQVTPWLGASAHVLGVLSDGDTLVHVHPMESPDPSLPQMLHFRFPEPGDYRLWIQFLDGGVLRTVPLSVTVYKK